MECTRHHHHRPASHPTRSLITWRIVEGSSLMKELHGALGACQDGKSPNSWPRHMNADWICIALYFALMADNVTDTMFYVVFSIRLWYQMCLMTQTPWFWPTVYTRTVCIKGGSDRLQGLLGRRHILHRQEHCACGDPSIYGSASIQQDSVRQGLLFR